MKLKKASDMKLVSLYSTPRQYLMILTDNKTRPNVVFSTPLLSRPSQAQTQLK